MNSLFNSALKQSQSLGRDIHNFEQSPAIAVQGQISASLASFARTIDDYDSMAKRELIPAKQEKALERVRNFRQQYTELNAHFNQLRSQREEVDTATNRTELLGRRSHSSATPDNPYSYNSTPTGKPASAPATGSTVFGAPATSSNLTRESHGLYEQNFLSRTNDALDEFLARGRAVQEDLAMNRMTLKGTQRKLYTVANTLGVSGDTIRMVERRAREDRWIFYGGVVVFLVFCYLVVKWLR